VSPTLSGRIGTVRKVRRFLSTGKKNAQLKERQGGEKNARIGFGGGGTNVCAGGDSHRPGGLGGHQVNLDDEMTIQKESLMPTQDGRTRPTIIRARAVRKGVSGKTRLGVPFEPLDTETEQGRERRRGSTESLLHKKIENSRGKQPDSGGSKWNLLFSIQPRHVRRKHLRLLMQGPKRRKGHGTD